jgi:response regulator RpfG family c-di-GMP phosphodiesterase
VLKIIYVDDEELNLMTFSLLLEKDYEIFTAPGAKEALKIIDENSINIIISDQRMPGMKGSEFLEIINKKNPDSLRIIHSAYTYDELIQTAIKNKIAHYVLEKPLNVIELKNVINKYLDSLI